MSCTSNPNWMTAALTAGAAVVGAFALMTSMNGKSTCKHGTSQDDASDSVTVTLPAWAIASSKEYFSKRYTTDEEMMSLAIHLSDRNITEGTGGPFGTAIFERHESKEGSYCTLAAIGMNRVVTLGNSTLHGETVAIQMAQKRLGSYTLKLGEKGGRKFELFTSCEPCCMCLGATLWSGVSRLVCAGAKADAQVIGFDEGPVFEESYKHLEKAGIQVTRNVLRAEAAKVLQRYGNEGTIY